MAIGKRIRLFRNRNKITQKQLGELLGFPEKTSDVRVAQYESEFRVPKSDLIEKMACTFGVSPCALTVPNIDSYTGLMHTFFALEDMYGLKINEFDGKICLHFSPSAETLYSSLFDMFCAWYEQASKLRRGEITQKEYDQWRYCFPFCDS